MSTSEEIPLQGVDVKEAEAGKQPEPPEGNGDTQGRNSKGKAPTGRWMKLFIAVMSLVAFALLTTGISMITPFYPIVVSCIIIHASFIVDLRKGGLRLSRN